MKATGRLWKFLKTPKGLLTIVLVAFVAIAAPHEGLHTTMPGLLMAVLVAGSIDAAVLVARGRRWAFPDGAVLTALIVAMVLSAQQPWYIAPVTAALAVTSKYVVRSRASNVFNPAALAIVATFYAFQTGQSWWGALPEVAPAATLLLLVGTGVFIADRVNRLPLVLVFLGTYYALFTATAFVGDPGWVAEVFRAPDLQAALFFAFFILTDPPTSPVKYRDQVICGALVAGVSYAAFEWVGAVYYLLAGVLVGNVWEAWRRVSQRTGCTFPRGLGTFVRELSPWRHATLPRAASART
jgi:Na+-translocating ferredoxin:NAD+ oxidoreductase RnfD subunit